MNCHIHTLEGLGFEVNDIESMDEEAPDDLCCMVRRFKHTDQVCLSTAVFQRSKPPLNFPFVVVDMGDQQSKVITNRIVLMSFIRKLSTIDEIMFYLKDYDTIQHSAYSDSSDE